jgi:hypothetical protein
MPAPLQLLVQPNTSVANMIVAINADTDAPSNSVVFATACVGDNLGYSAV